MPQFSQTKEAVFSTKQMFDLVADVEKYPLFVPLCKSLTIRERHQKDTENQEVLLADMQVAYGLVRESFSSKVTLKPETGHIDIKYINGPFSHMESNWQFSPLPDGGCRIEFQLDYAFKSRMLSSLMGSLFDKMFSKFSDAFLKRAQEIYQT